MIANPAGHKVHFGRPFVKVPVDFFDRIGKGGYAGVALAVYITLAAYANDLSLLAWPLVSTACQRIGMSSRTWKGATRTLKDARRIFKGAYASHVPGTIAYKVKPLGGRWAVGVDGQTDWTENAWTWMSTDLAWERFSLSAWRLLIRMAYHDRHVKTVAAWAAEAGLGSTRAHAAMAELVEAGWVDKAEGTRPFAYQVARKTVMSKPHLTLVPELADPGEDENSRISGIGPSKSRNWPTDRDLLNETINTERSRPSLVDPEVASLLAHSLALLAGQPWWSTKVPAHRRQAALLPYVLKLLAQAQCHLDYEASRPSGPQITVLQPQQALAPDGNEF